MMTSTRGSVLRLLQWQARNATVYVLGGVLAFLLWEILENRLELVDISMPALPLGVVGGALGIFVSFRTNAAYDRWWEGRKLWGRLINTSRHWSSQVMAYVPGVKDRERMVRRHVAYVHMLKALLRDQDPLLDDDCAAYLTEAEKRQLPEESNQTHYLLDAQLREAYDLASGTQIDGLQLQSLDETVRHLLDIQGGCERIKKTPMPPGYGFIADRLILFFSLLFPLAIVEEVHLLVIPINLLVCLAFMLISEAGRVIENPFTLFFNGLPLQNMASTIEHNLMNRLGVRSVDLKPIAGPDPRGILM